MGMPRGHTAAPSLSASVRHALIGNSFCVPVVEQLLQRGELAKRRQLVEVPWQRRQRILVKPILLQSRELAEAPWQRRLII